METTTEQAKKILQAAAIQPDEDVKETTSTGTPEADEEENQRQRQKPHLYTTAEQLEKKVNEYFETGGTLREVIVGNGANKQIRSLRVHTITGLCLFLGYCDRASFLDQERNPILSSAIKRARTRIEAIYEENLQTTGNSGNIFALKNFGWVDKQEIIHEEKVIKLDV